MGIVTNENNVYAELARGELGLAQKYGIRVDQNTAHRSSQLHLDRKVARIAAEIEYRLPCKVLGQEGLNDFPPALRQVSGLAAVTGPQAVRQLEMLVPPTK